jgi:hypothetical protein
MLGEIGRACERVVVHKMKRKECIKKIVDSAQRTGVANVTLVWREFSACSKTMVMVAVGSNSCCVQPQKKWTCKVTRAFSQSTGGKIISS